jgi:hypothetical protein
MIWRCRDVSLPTRLDASLRHPPRPAASGPEFSCRSDVGHALREARGPSPPATYCCSADKPLRLSLKGSECTHGRVLSRFRACRFTRVAAKKFNSARCGAVFRRIFAHAVTTSRQGCRAFPARAPGSPPGVLGVKQESRMTEL